MISKILSGHSFGPACRYICNRTEAKVLAAEGVRGYDYKKMAGDFIFQHQLHPSKKQACFHAVLSFYPGENPGDEKMLEIAKKYLEEIGIKDTQFAITKHTDKKHLHLHIIANLINNKGQVISDSWIGQKGKKAAQKLTETYQLIPAKRKNLSLTHLESLNRSEANRYKIYEVILNNLPQCKTISELEKRLKKQGITTIYKYKGQTKEKQGISFQLEKDCFKGSKVDRKFSLGNLEKYFSYRQRQRQKSMSIYKPPTKFSDIPSQKLHSDTIEIGKTISYLITEAMKPEDELAYDNEYNNRLRERKKRKKKKKRQGLYR